MTVLSYFLAVDVGTSRTAASTARFAADGSLLTAPFPLGRSSDSAPSAVFAADGELLFGESAERRGIAQPERLVREFKRRVGDDVPIRAGGERFAAEDLYARMVAWVVDAVAEREGTRPTALAVTVPVAWGGHRSGVVAAALAREIPGEIRLISEPEAAACHYESTSPLGIDRTLAVYDLGGGTFDAVVLRKDADGGVRIVGDPIGIGDFGGADFDDLVLRRVVAAAGLAGPELAADPATRVALSTLRRECVEAKEALSFDSEAVVPVLVGASPTTVRLTRSEFEELIEGGVDRTVEALAHALETAGVEDGDLEAILLTGGSSRIPRIAELLSERFDRPIAIDADPKAIVALGAARTLAAADARAGRLAASAVATVAAGSALALTTDAAAALAPLDGPAEGHPAFDAAGSSTPASATAKRRWFERLPATAAIATGALVLATGIVLGSATGLGSSPAATREEDPQTLADWLGVALFDATAAVAALATEPVAATAPAAPSAPPPPESIRRADFSPQRSAPRASNPRTESMRKAIAASPAPSAPSSAAGGGSGSSGTGSSGTGSTTPVTTTPGTTTPGTGSDPAPSPSETQAPAPSETQAPAPSETQAPAPTETQAPAPEETTPPAPEETTPPAPEETTPPAPEPTSEPAPDPAPEPPAPEPSPSPTDPV